MRNTIRWSLSVTLLISSLASAGVSVEHARQVDFSQYRTFSWIEGTAAEELEVEKWLRKAVTDELRGKGLQMVAESGDVLVRTHVTVRDEQRFEVDILGNPSQWQSDVTAAGPTGVYTREVGVGTVVVDLLDGYTKLQVWQGIASAVTAPEVSKRSEQRIKKAAAKLFKKYPPP